MPVSATATKWPLPLSPVTYVFSTVFIPMCTLAWLLKVKISKTGDIYETAGFITISSKLFISISPINVPF